MSNPASNTEAIDPTDAMMLAGAAAGKNRQCSIGWHAECSDPNGYECQCPCHNIVGMAQHATGDMNCPATAVIVVGTDGEPHVAMTPEASIPAVRAALKIALEALDTQEAEEVKEAAKKAKNQRLIAIQAALDSGILATFDSTSKDKP